MQKDRSGLSLNDLEKLTRDGALGRQLRRSTVNSALRGDRRPSRDLVESLLRALQLPAGDREGILAVWTRLTDQAHARHSAVPRVVDCPPRELGVHAAIRPPGWTDEMPSYVERYHDPLLRKSIEEGIRGGGFVVVVGASSTGKTRSLYEAVNELAGQFALIQPSDTGDIYQLNDEADNPCVVWLDELTRFFGSTPELNKVQVLRLKRAGHLVVGTMWYDEYTASKTSPVERDLLGLATIVNVKPHLDATEHRRATKLAETDASIRVALESSEGLIQVLAAGPDLVRHYEHAPPHALAAITAAADARRLGILTPLPVETLVEAMAGYLGESDRAAAPTTWWDAAAPHAEQQINETTLSALCKVEWDPGTPARYRAADYLAQHLRAERRTACPPPSFWTALIKGLDGREDLRRLHDAAVARMRYRAQELALRRMAVADDVQACADLAFLLVRQDRIDEATSFLARHMGRREVEDMLGTVIALRSRADSLTGDDRADLLYDRGELADLQDRADRGSATAADDCANLLTERGDLAKLRVRAATGHRLAADLLAELSDVGRTGEDSDSVDEITRLRDAVGRGEMDAAERLTSLLFELGSVEELRAEVDAGTPSAVDRLLALMMVNGSKDVIRLRAFGLECDASDPTEGKHHARH